MKPLDGVGSPKIVLKSVPCELRFSSIQVPKVGPQPELEHETSGNLLTFPIQNPRLGQTAAQDCLHISDKVFSEHFKFTTA